jgi:hypothetical protein
MADASAQLDLAAKTVPNPFVAHYQMDEIECQEEANRAASARTGGEA